MYEKEAQQQTEKVEKMKAEGKDEYDIKKQVALLLLNKLSRVTELRTKVPPSCKLRFQLFRDSFFFFLD